MHVPLPNSKPWLINYAIDFNKIYMLLISTKFKIINKIIKIYFSLRIPCEWIYLTLFIWWWIIVSCDLFDLSSEFIILKIIVCLQYIFRFNTFLIVFFINYFILFNILNIYNSYKLTKYQRNCLVYFFILIWHILTKLNEYFTIKYITYKSLFY